MHPEHRNALGFVVSDSSNATRYGEAGIVFGLRADGARVFIDNAKRGGSEHLKCECGADLVARKGEINIHHFAHAAGGGSECRLAQMRAMSLFACSVLLETGELLLPILRGRHRNIEVSDVEERHFGECAGILVTTTEGSKQRELAVIFTLRKHAVLPSAKELAAIPLSAIQIDLLPLRNMPDTAIAKAIVSEARRYWLYNEKYPNAVREQRVDLQQGDPYRIRPVGKVPATRPRSLISEVEWKTLSPAELRRRLFGNKYDR